jgi:hypothetical protein
MLNMYSFGIIMSSNIFHCFIPYVPKLVKSSVTVNCI